MNFPRESSLTILEFPSSKTYTFPDLPIAIEQARQVLAWGPFVVTKDKRELMGLLLPVL
jgi:hypothetical protein